MTSVYICVSKVVGRIIEECRLIFVDDFNVECHCWVECIVRERQVGYGIFKAI